jgi:beta-galactosidase
MLKMGLAATAAVVSPRLALSAATSAEEHPAPSTSEPPAHDASAPSPRERLLLDFNWRFHLGHASDPAKDFNFGKMDFFATFAKSGRIGPVTYLKFDDSAWRTLDLPHDWAVELPFRTAPPADTDHGAKPLGREFPETSIGWYRRVIPLPAADAGKRISIEFDGIFRRAEVFFNGFYLGTNLSGYAPFSFDVTDFANPGEKNILTVRVDASLGEGWSYEGAGIYRHVWLVKTAPIHLTQWSQCVRTEVKNELAMITVLAEVHNQSDQDEICRAVTTILDPAGKVVATAASEPARVTAFGRLNFSATASILDPQLWSIERDQKGKSLYRAITRIQAGRALVDSEETTFGIRTLRWDANEGFFLNGKPTKLLGTCNHNDHAGVGTALPDRLHRYRIERLLEMGSNAYRTAHNPPTPEFLDACDELGMMVMCETRMFSSSPEGLSQLERMIRRYCNHPAIIIWSLGNEEMEQDSPRGLKICRTMRQKAHELDPTRLTTDAMDRGWGEGVSKVIDVQGFNYFWDRMTMDDFHRKFPQLPCVITEIGSHHATRGIYQNGDARGYFSAYEADRSASLPTPERWWTYCSDRRWLAGGFIWAGFDYRGEARHPWPTNSSRSGILDTCGFPKDDFYYYRAWWQPEPVLHLLPHWNWTGKEGQEIDVWCYSNLDSVELFLNDVSLGSQRVVRNSHLAWKVKYSPGVIEARGMKNGQLALTQKRETTGAPARIALRADRTRIHADAQDVSVISVEVLDAQGRTVPTAANLVEFALSGPGQILGVGNGDPSCSEPDKAEQRSAFNGFCQAIVQSRKEAGEITLRATSQGLESASVTIQSDKAAPRPFVE